MSCSSSTTKTRGARLTDEVPVAGCGFVFINTCLHGVTGNESTRRRFPQGDGGVNCGLRRFTGIQDGGSRRGFTTRVHNEGSQRRFRTSAGRGCGCSTSSRAATNASGSPVAQPFARGLSLAGGVSSSSARADVGSLARSAAVRFLFSSAARRENNRFAASRPWGRCGDFR